MMDKIFPRSILTDIRKELGSNKIIILNGSRRVGKTVLLHMLKDEIRSQQIPHAFLDLDIEANLKALFSLDHFLDYLRQEQIDLSKKAIIFIDEFQHAQKSAPIFKNIYDHYPQLKIIASGSSSLSIKKLLQESLAGRKRIFHVFPLTFKEMLEFQKEDSLIHAIELIKEVQHPKEDLVFQLIQKFQEYAVFGGYPEVVLAKTAEEKIAELQDIYESYIKKDIRSFFHVENIQAYNRLLELLAVNTGQLTNSSNLSREIGIHRNTLENYLKLFEDTFIISFIRPFYVNKTKEIVKSVKIYFEDTGMRNVIIGDFQKNLGLRIDAGSLLENAVLSEVSKHKTLLDKIYFWRLKSGNEVDFILQKGPKLFPIEVKTSLHLAGSETKSLRNFLNLHQQNAPYGLLLSNKKAQSQKNIHFQFWWEII